MMMIRAALVALALTSLTACGGAAEEVSEVTPTQEQSAQSSSPTATEEPEENTPASAAERIEALPQVEKVITVTEDNDPNDMIGRPNGYVAGFVIADIGLTCPELGASCGGTLEVWPDEAAARDRSDYIQGILKDAPAFGTEYHYLDGAMLLRVVGDVKPSSAKEYQAAFMG